jgi:hypothetical protein
MCIGYKLVKKISPQRAQSAQRKISVRSAVQLIRDHHYKILTDEPDFTD